MQQKILDYIIAILFFIGPILFFASSVYNLIIKFSINETLNAIASLIFLVGGFIMILKVVCTKENVKMDNTNNV